MNTPCSDAVSASTLARKRRRCSMTCSAGWGEPNTAVPALSALSTRRGWAAMPSATMTAAGRAEIRFARSCPKALLSKEAR